MFTISYLYSGFVSLVLKGKEFSLCIHFIWKFELFHNVCQHIICTRTWYDQPYPHLTVDFWENIIKMEFYGGHVVATDAPNSSLSLH